MINNFFAVTCDQFNLGTHFLIWSVHYCANEKDYYLVKDHTFDSVKGKRFVTLPENPFDGVTAHKMYANTISPAWDIDSIIRNSRGKLNHIREFPDASYVTTNIPGNKSFLKRMEAHGIRSVNVTCKGLQFLIGFLRSNISETNWQHDFNAVTKYCKYYWPNFFDNAHIFENNLKNWHDIREGIAFMIRPYDFPVLGNNSANTYDCQIEDLLMNGEDEIQKIFHFLGLELHESNLEHWCKMHGIWKDALYHYVHFCNDIELIIECILQNKSYNLEKYQMNVLKEGVLLHLLMFRHELNLTKSIEKFPNNTQDIYRLLGKNNRTGHAKVY